MAKVIPITNGTGSSELINGTYTVTASVNGYDNSFIQPDSVVIDQSTNTYSFTICANGTLTLHVTDDGTSTGNPIFGATFVRVDSTGTEYGSVITTGSDGNAIFENVPYADTDAPVIYYRQTSSDGEHEFDSSIQSITMTTDTQTIEIENTVGATRTIQLTDANYDNMPIESGTLTFTN